GPALPVPAAGLTRPSEVGSGEPATVLIAGSPASDEMRIEASTKSSWEHALEGLAFDSKRSPRAGEQLLALLRAGHHLGHIEKEDDLLQSILQDAVACLDAQRGAIVLADGVDDKLKLKALV